MRSARFGLIVFSLLLSIPTCAQQASTSQQKLQTPEQASQAEATIQQSLIAQNRGTQITDIMMTGSITFTQGVNKGMGTINYSAWAGGQSQGKIVLPTGTESSFRDYSVSPKVGKYIGIDGVSKNALAKDMIGPHPALYFPVFIMASALSSPNYASADMGQEMQQGLTVRHVAIWPMFGGSTVVPTAALKFFGQQDLYLDPTTWLPVELTFSLSGTNANKKVTPFRKVDLYVPEEVFYLDYRIVQGVEVASHIQVYVKKTLVMDIQISSVTVNSGAAISVN